MLGQQFLRHQNGFIDRLHTGHRHIKQLGLNAAVMLDDFQIRTLNNKTISRQCHLRCSCLNERGMMHSLKPARRREIRARDLKNVGPPAGHCACATKKAPG
jgi:hypothetical protein